MSVSILFISLFLVPSRGPDTGPTHYVLVEFIRKQGKKRQAEMFLYKFFTKHKSNLA